MILPLWDENPFNKDRWPVVSWTLIGINIAAFLAVSGMSDEAYQVFVDRWGLTPAALFHPTSLLSLVTPFTATFLHANWVHLLSNMLMFWIVGDDVEEALGRWRFAIFYLACGLLGSLAYAISAPQSTMPRSAPRALSPGCSRLTSCSGRARRSPPCCSGSSYASMPIG